MTYQTEKHEPAKTEKNKLLGRLTYVPNGSKGYGVNIGPVFSTSREGCQAVKVESIPLDLIRDAKDGQLGAFFIWAPKDEAGA